MNFEKLDNKNLVRAVVLLAIIGAIVWMLFFDESDSASVPGSQNATAATPNAVAEVPTAKCDTLPERMLKIPAPNANELIIAARLLREAADPAFAAASIELSKKRDLAEMDLKLWKAKAETAESEAKWAKAKAQSNQIAKTGSPGSGGYESNESNSTRRNQNIALGGDAVLGDLNSVDNFRLGSPMDKSGAVSVFLDRWYTVKVGQYAKGFLVESYDKNIECVFLKNQKTDEKIPVCFN